MRFVLILQALICAALLAALAMPAPACAETRIFELQHRSAGELGDAVQGMLDGQGSVTVVQNRLVVTATPAALTNVSELLAQLDRPRRMLRIFVGQRHTQADQRQELAVSGRLSTGSATVDIAAPAGPPRGGASLSLAGGDDRLHVEAQSTTRRESHTAEQFIVTLEGSPARLSVGKRIPFSEHWLGLARRHARTFETVHYETLDTGFEVAPVLFGDMVQLTIHPYLAFQDPWRPREIQFRELTTTVLLPLGAWVDLGGTMSSRDEVSREILGAGSGHGEGGGVVRVRVEMQPE